MCLARVDILKLSVKTNGMGLRDKLRQAGLSNRECEVVEVVATGVMHKQAAAMLFVTEKTIKFHLTNIFKKLSVKSKGQLILWCAPYMDFVEKPAAAVAAAAAVEPKKENELGWDMPYGINKVASV